MSVWTIDQHLPGFRSQSWFALLAAVLLLAAGVLRAAPANSTNNPGARRSETNRATGEGLRGVAVTGDTIRMLGWPTKGVVRVAEFRPGLPISIANATSVVSRLVVQTQFVARIPRFEGGRDRLYSSFMALLEEPRAGLQPLGTNRFVEEMLNVATDGNPLPEKVGKKGIVIGRVEEDLTLGVQHGAIFLNLGAMVNPEARPDSLTAKLDGWTLHFDRAFIDALDAQVFHLTQSGVLVTLVLQNASTGDLKRDRWLLHPNYDTNCPNHLSAFNTVTPEGRLWFRGCLEFLAARYSEPGHPHGRVVNYVIGQRVNAHGQWYNQGRASLESVVADYERTLRIAWTAVRRHSSVARIFAAVENHWTILPPGNDAQTAAPARAFLEALNKATKRHGDLDWQVAFHAWPESGTNLRPWLDAAATTNADTAVISFKNLDRLPRFLYQYDQLYRRQPRRVMICGQGFASGEGKEGERLRSAALAYAWVQSERTVGIESFMLKRSPGVADAIPDRVGKKRDDDRLFDEVYRAAGTPRWTNATEFALPLIGLKSWDDLPSTVK